MYFFLGTLFVGINSMIQSPEHISLFCHVDSNCFLFTHFTTYDMDCFIPTVFCNVISTYAEVSSSSRTNTCFEFLTEFFFQLVPYSVTEGEVI